MIAHRYPADAPAEVLAWKCGACGHVIREFGPREESDCPGVPVTAQPWLSTWPVAGKPTYRAHDTEQQAQAHVDTLKVTGYPQATVMWGGEPEHDPRARVGGAA